MGSEGEARRPALEQPGADGCLVIAIRLPVRVLAFVVVLPLRLVWDLLAAVCRGIDVALRWTGRRLLLPPLAFVWHYVLAATGRALRRLGHVLVVVPVVWVCRRVVVPVARAFGAAAVWTVRVLVVVPVVWVWRTVVVPVARAFGAAAVWTVRVLVIVPVVVLWRRVVVPVVRALGAAVVWTVRVLVVVPVVRVWRNVVVPVVGYLVVTPVRFLWRRVVVPVAREIGVGLVFAWRGTAYVSRAVGRVVGLLGRVLVVVPVAWAWNALAVPVLQGLRAAGRWYRRAIWRPAADAVADARRTVRRALIGTSAAPAERRPVGPPRDRGAGPPER